MRDFSNYLIILACLICMGIAGKAHCSPDKYVSGYFRTYAEFEEDELAGDDFDLAGYLSFDVEPTDRMAFHFYGRARADLDGTAVTDDALDRADSRVFQAFLDVREIGALDLRIGRQWIHDIAAVYLDGLQIQIPLHEKFKFLVFGGRPVPAYTSADGDSLFGAQIDCMPFQSTRIRVDGVRNDEDNPIVNDHIGLHVDQGIGRSATLFYDQTFLNRRDKDFRLGGTWFIPMIASEVYADYYRRTSTTPVPDRDDVDARYFSDFYQILEEVQELERFSVDLIKYIGEHVIAGGGFSTTDVREKETPFNRDSDRYFVSCHLIDLWVETFDISLDANWVESTFSDMSTTTFTDVDGSQVTAQKQIRLEDDSFFITGELRYSPIDDLELSVGSSYGDYDFKRDRTNTQELADLVPRDLVFTTGSERLVTRTYFSGVTWRINPKWRTRWLLEYDRSQINSTIDTNDYVRAAGWITYTF